MKNPCSAVRRTLAWQRPGLALCVGLLFSLAPIAAHAAEPFNGGEVSRGDISVKISDHGILSEISYKGEKLLSQHPGGVSTTGSKADPWQPYVSQSGLGKIKLTKDETPQAVTLVAKGVLTTRDGASDFTVSTRIEATSITQTASITAPTADLWRRFGTSYLIDADTMPGANYRGDEGKWVAVTPDRGNRNLIYKTPAAVVDVWSAKYKIRFSFDGLKTCLFDDRKPGKPFLNLEFSLPPQETTSPRGEKNIGGTWSATIELSPNDGKLAIAPPPVAPASAIDLTQPARLISKTDWRTRYSLDGPWDMQVVGGAGDFPQDLRTYPPAVKTWSKAAVPSVPFPQDGWASDAHAAWYRTAFTVPGNLKGKALYLHFEEISYDSYFYLNGKMIGHHFGGYAPVDVALGDAVNFDVANKLEVFVGDSAAALDKRRYPDGPPKAFRLSDFKPESLFAPVYEARRGILQFVSLDALPEVYAEDACVRTSVRKWEISAETTVTNTTMENRTVTIRHAVLDGKSEIKQLATQTLVIPPGGSATGTVAAPWRDPKLWDVRQPNLYILRTDVVANGKVVDSRQTRFGFREFWAEGTSFYLNGTKIKLREAATHIYYHPGRMSWDKQYYGKPEEGARAELQAIQETNFNCTRMVHRPHPDYYYDAADELGHLVIAHMPLGFIKDSFEFDHPLLASTTKKMIGELVRKDRNHPSIIMWEGENEGFPYGLNASALKYAEYYDTCVGQVCARLDPTRMIKYGGDGDILGRAPIVDMHGGDRRPNDECFPNATWRILDFPPQRLYGYVGGSKWRWQKDKPLYIGEGLYFLLGAKYKADEADKNPATTFIGETVFDDPMCGDGWYAGQEKFYNATTEYFKIGIPIWRMMDAAAGYCPWEVWGGQGTGYLTRSLPTVQICRDLMKPERFFWKQLYSHFFGGSVFQRDFCFLNDSQQPRTYQIQWQAIADGRTIAEKSFTLAIPPAEVRWQAISFAFPTVAEKKNITLHVTMQRDGQTLHEEQLPLQIYPRVPLTAQPKGTMAIFDPAGKTAPILEKAGLKLRRLADLNEISGTPPALLIIGQNAFTDDTTIPPALDDYVRGGGRVLILPQTSWVAYAPATRPPGESPMTSSIVFAAAKGHPVLTGISEDDLRFWNHPDWDAAHSVAVDAPGKFVAGNVRPILECDTLWTSPLQEVQYGRGLYIECSLDLIRKLNDEPVAALLLNNILKYANDYQANWAQFAILGDAAKAESLNQRGFTCGNIAAPPAGGILMITSESAKAGNQADALRSFAQNGGTIWIHARKDFDKSLIEQVTGVKIKEQPYPADWRARMVRRTAAGKESPLLAGISGVVLYERNSVDNLWVITGADVTELASGGAVVAIRVGKGLVIVERLAWDAPTTLAHKHWADHFVNALATNLHIPVDLFRNAPRKVYRAADFQTVDLRTVCNRGFRDDVAGDGQGGWTDQGPDNDLRGMKTGRQMFGQIAFDIVDPEQNHGRSCVVLHSAQHDAAAVAATAEIPVNRKAKMLLFLHTSAWYSATTQKGAPLIHYLIQYADGTQEKASALGGDHIRDWWVPGPCEQAQSVTLRLQTTTEADVAARQRSLQIQEWANPHPEKDIRAIVIQSGETGAVPVVLGISLTN